MPALTRPACADDRGFTMIELLMVMLIVAILAALALPAFTGQRIRGQDTEAQQTLRTVATTLALYHADARTYDATRAQLVRIEPAVGEATAALAIHGTDNGYAITETSRSRTTFTLTRANDGSVTRSCSTPSRGLCRGDGTW